jgi:hypothetical protein
METVYTWQATDGNGETYQYEFEPYPLQNRKCWYARTGDVKYVGEPLLDVSWYNSLVRVFVKDRYDEGYSDGYDECLRQQRG